MCSLRKIFVALFAGAILACVLASCEKNRTPVEEAIDKGILLIGNSADPESLDPSLATGFSESRIINALFEGLVGADTTTLAPKPAVAKSWKISKDRRTYTFFLDERAKWSDGSPLTADDFVFAWLRSLNPNISAEYSTMLYRIKNAERIAKTEEKDLSKFGAKAIDAHTLEIELEKPCPYFLSLLYHNIYFPLPRKTLEKFGADKFPNAIWTKPENIVSNGAFVLKKWSINDKVCVRRNPHYREPELIKLNGIDFYPISNINTEDRAFRAGQLHLTDSICPHRIKDILAKTPQNFRSDKWLGVYYYIFNTAKKPFDDPRVRRALTLAIDRNTIIDNFLKAKQQPAYSFIPKGCGGISEPRNIPKKQDIELAKKLLAQAGFPNGEGFPTIKITYNVSEQHKPIAEAIQQMWKNNLNINAELYNLSWPAYLAARRAKDFDVARASWIGDFAEPETFLEMFSSDSGLNHSSWKNPDFDNLLKSAENAITKQHRLSTLRQAEELMLENAPVMPIYFFSKVYQILPCVKNWNANLLDYHDYKGVYLQKSDD